MKWVYGVSCKIFQAEADANGIQFSAFLLWVWHKAQAVTQSRPVEQVFCYCFVLTNTLAMLAKVWVICISFEISSLYLLRYIHVVGQAHSETEHWMKVFRIC